MKYIRTKDAIGTETIDNAGIKWRDVKGYSTEIVKQADTIEELCDRFVICGKPDYYELYEDFDEVKDLFYAENVTNIYGAIWTDKGLIFVAKLNNKGKLELLWVKV